jgi:hypothetical protein
VQWSNAHSVVQDGVVIMRFQISLSGMPVSGANVISKVVFPNEQPIFTKLVSDGEGHAETRVPAHQDVLDAAAIFVQAVHGEHTATRKYRLRQVG